MTLFDFDELASYWVEHPPVHVLVGAYLGVGKDPRRRMPSAGFSPGGAASSDPQAILAELGPGFGEGDVHTGLPGVVLDFSELRRRVRNGN